MGKDKGRFIKVYSQGNGLTSGYQEIFVDKFTGVNYIFVSEGYAGGLTVLVDQNGKPIVTPISDYD